MIVSFLICILSSMIWFMHNFETFLQPTLMQGRSFLKVQLYYFEIGSWKMQLKDRIRKVLPITSMSKEYEYDNMISIDNVGGK